MEEAESLENDFSSFVEQAWPSIDSAKYKQNWALDGVCEHLQAVADGHIKRLLINIPFRCGKSLVTSVCFPAWVWARRKTLYTSGPGVGFLCGSYSHTLSLTHSNLTRRLILSPWYQARWGNRFKLRTDQNTKTQFDTDKQGYRIATSVGGALLGIGGAILMADDPHNTEQVESEAELETVNTWWREFSTTRLNDQDLSALLVNMQRLAQNDISGSILSSQSEEWVHYCVPMRYEWGRHCVTVLGWEDPRGLDDEGESLVRVAADGTRYPRDAEAAHLLNEEREGELMWPERFSEARLKIIETEMGPYMASGRLQQSPQPKGGGIFKREWWQLWEHPEGKFPTFEYLIASLDSAFTEQEQNDPSALTVWGVFMNPEGKRRIMLVHAWRKHLEFSGPRIERLGPQESDVGFRQRTMGSWGLMEWVQDTCKRFKVDKLLIEAKASGISAAQELRNRYNRQDWAIQLCQVSGDKVARAYAVQPSFSQLLVYAPAFDWVETVIEEMEVFPKGRYKDLTDSATQAIKYLRDTGMANTDEETHAAEMEGVMHRPRPKAMYPC